MGNDIKYIIDRIEEEFAVCENINTNEYVNIQANKLPKNIKESDIIKLIDNIYVIDEVETNKIKQNLKSRIDNLWKK